MKKIILLAAAVVPMLAAADVVNPTGSLYSTDGKIILPPFASATWSNGEDIVWKIGTKEPTTQIGSQASKTAPVNKLPGTYIMSAGAETFSVTFGSISSSAKVAKGTNANLSSEDATAQINTVAPAWTNTHVGYAQLIKAANAPYSFTSVTLPSSITPNEDITVDVYESVEGIDGVITLGEPVAQLTPGETSYNASAPVAVAKDLIIVINGIDEANALKAAANCSGAYYAFTYNNATETNALGLTAVPATADKSNYALDITLGGVYTPFAAIFADEKVYTGDDTTIDIDFDNNVDAFTCVGYFSCNSIDNITIDGQPSWLAVSIDKDSEATNAYVVNLSLPTNEHDEAWVKLSVPGATSPTFHITYEGVTGIEDVDAAATEVVAREYFDLQGRRLNEAPQSGFYIERATLANGKVTSRTIRR